jgi:outer membrane protein OmpA-like peptidoglycan-associated protein
LGANLRIVWQFLPPYENFSERHLSYNSHSSRASHPALMSSINPLAQDFHMQIRKFVALPAILVFGLSACATDEYGNKKPMTDTQKGAIIGVLSGAAIGAAVKDENRGKGAVIGAIGGGVAGAGVGAYMDSQKKDFEKALAPERDRGAIQIEKLGEKSLRVTMTAQSAFAVDSSEIKGTFHSTLDKISTIVNKYGKTTIAIVGHTDSTGSDAHNQTLSERRAEAVEQYFLGKKVVPQRLSAHGRGESEPRASNNNEEGRALNRRVELFIEAVVAQPGQG